MNCSLPGSSVQGILQSRILWVATVGCHFLLQGIFPTQGWKPASPAWADKFFTTEPPGKSIIFSLGYISTHITRELHKKRGGYILRSQFFWVQSSRFSICKIISSTNSQFYSLLSNCDVFYFFFLPDCCD